MISNKLIIILFVALTILATIVPSHAKTNPCGRNRRPLPNIFCGRGPDRQDCPYGFECIIAANDAFAVCCPVRIPQRTTTTTTTTNAPTGRPGSCPPPSGIPGPCVVLCNGDFSCNENEKCCGSCPRACVPAVY